jgi:glycosyltransferase involved in cell wall biosynthesis
VKALDVIGGASHGARLNTCPLNQATGLLAPPEGAEAIAVGVKRLLADASLRARLAQNAVKDARERFDLQREVKSYVDWYEELLRVPGRRTALLS